LTAWKHSQTLTGDVSDLIQKRKARKAEKNNTEVIDEEETAEPEPVIE